jgi:hypothetical protein
VGGGDGYAENVRTPDVELLWWEGCPSTERALDELRGALRELDLSGAEVHVREITTDAEAARTGFIGSPTILIDGQDVAPARAGEPAALSCRVYRRRDGRISPTPDPEDVKDTLRRAAARQEVS